MEIRKKLSNINFGIIALLIKILPKFLAVLTKLTKFFKFGKFGLAVVSVASYTYFFTWKFAIVIFVSILIHEYGHIWAMKRCGLKTKGIYFIPFIGAAAVTEESFKSRRDEAYIAIMGPIFGLILSIIVGIVYYGTKDTFFAATAGFMAMVNLFNLLPINPLDGGRMMKSVTFSINSKVGIGFLLLGIIVSILITYWTGILLFSLLLIIGTFELIHEYMTTNDRYLIRESIKILEDINRDKQPGEDTFFGYYWNDINSRVINILEDKKISDSEKMNIIISKGKEIGDIKNLDDKELRNGNIVECGTSVLCRFISDIYEKRDMKPKMTNKGIFITICSYVLIVFVLWGLAWYMRHVPEVDIAMKFFMS